MQIRYVEIAFPSTTSLLERLLTIAAPNTPSQPCAGFADESFIALRVNTIFKAGAFAGGNVDRKATSIDDESDSLCDFRSFFANCLKLCLYSPGQQETLQALFERYDRNGDGLLDYELFSAMVLGLFPNAEANSRVRNARAGVRNALSTNGRLTALFDFITALKQKADASGLVTRREAERALTSFARVANSWDVRDVIVEAARPHGGANLINCAQLHQMLAGSLSRRRRVALDVAWRSIDAAGRGAVPSSVISAAVDASDGGGGSAAFGASSRGLGMTASFRQPAAGARGSRGEFDGAAAAGPGAAAHLPPGRVTQEQFIEFYRSISALIESDEAFEAHLRNGYGADLADVERKLPVLVGSPTHTSQRLVARQLRPAPELEDPPSQQDGWGTASCLQNTLQRAIAPYGREAFLGRPVPVVQQPPRLPFGHGQPSALPVGASLLRGTQRPSPDAAAPSVASEYMKTRNMQRGVPVWRHNGPSAIF